MKIRATITPSEIQEAARITRGKRFWLRFFVANWYGTVICLLVLGTAIHGVFNGTHLHYGPMLLCFLLFGSLIWFSYYRYTRGLSTAAARLNADAATISLEQDGIKTVAASGASSFAPWSIFTSFAEGRSVFVLSGRERTIVLPVDEPHREVIRGLLRSKIA